MKEEKDQEKNKRAAKKQQWGAVIPLRRSSRNLDNGKIVLANAQDFKRKWNLEDNYGMNPKSSKIPAVSKSQLTSIAKKKIGVVIEDGHPDVDKLIELDISRMADSRKNCSHQGCRVPCPGQGEDPQTPKVESVVNEDLPVIAIQNGNSELTLDDQESGWSEARNRKKNRKKK